MAMLWMVTVLFLSKNKVCLNGKSYSAVAYGERFHMKIRFSANLAVNVRKRITNNILIGIQQFFLPGFFISFFISLSLSFYCSFFFLPIFLLFFLISFPFSFQSFFLLFVHFFFLSFFVSFFLFFLISFSFSFVCLSVCLSFFVVNFSRLKSFTPTHLFCLLLNNADSSMHKTCLDASFV